MNAAQPLRRPTAAVVLQSLLWLWLLGLSVFAILGHQTMTDQADQQQLDVSVAAPRSPGDRAGRGPRGPCSSSPQPPPPQACKTLGRQWRRASFKAEQALGGYATAEDVQALRTEVEQIKVRQATARAAAPTQRRTPSQTGHRQVRTAAAAISCRRR
ncbi:hypothetical protein [Achromobacter marplatensis]|uniref:hypothetical protein n=1 Tax=Achromobacter marplatensis TaxID=470868 RepID=UPI003CFEB40E